VTGRGVRRAELAVAAFGATAFLLALIFTVDVVRFHRDVLLSALAMLPRGEVHLQGALLLALVVFDLLALGRIGLTGWRGVRAHRRVVQRLPVLDRRDVAGGTVAVVAGARPLAFCVGLLRPRVYVSRGAVERLPAAQLAAVVAHERHHAKRRDPLRILVARAIGSAYSLRALPRREQALAELAADAAAVRSAGVAPLAAALLAFGGEDGAGIAPERVDRLAGEGPADEVSRALVAGAGAVIAGLLVLLGLGVVVHDRPPVCLPLGSAPLWLLLAVALRFAAMAPAWLGWRRAGAFLA
jgi:hypothetical protein